MRCFLAINLSTEIKNYLEDVILGLEKNNPYSRIKWVEKQNLHLTLAFIENIEKSKLNELNKLLKKIDLKKFILTLSDLSFFPTSGSPRVVKVNLNDPDGSVLNLYKQIQTVLKDLDLPTDSKPYTAHITLGRLKPYGSELHFNSCIEPLSFPVCSFELIESKLTSKGPIYKTIKEYPLA